MKYIMTDYSTDVIKDVTIGTCEICMSTEDVDAQYFHLQDEDGREYKVPGHFYDIYDGISYVYIENIPHFAAWLEKQDLFVPVEHDFWWIYGLVHEYKKKFDMDCLCMKCLISKYTINQD